MTRIETMIGFRIKIVERAGTTLKNTLPNTNPWAGAHCSRSDCTTCNQGMEELPDCTKRSLVYESICADCNPGAIGKGELKIVEQEEPSIYVGETARSIYERGKEHWEAWKSRREDSHIYKHMELHHGGKEDPNFVFKVVQFHRSALSRQVGEAVRIRRRGGEGGILNSRSEYSRCRITRLTLGKGDEKENEKMSNEQDDGAEEYWGEQTEWSQGLLAKREELDKKGRKALGAPEKTTSKKRLEEEGGKGCTEKKRRSKKLKHSMIPEEWGEDGAEEGKTLFLYSGLEGVGSRIVGEGKRKKEILAKGGDQRKITSWTQVLGRGEDPHYGNKTNDIRKLMIEWGGMGRKAITWILEKQLALMAPLSEQTKTKDNKLVMAPLCSQKGDKKTPQVQKVGRKKVWKQLKNGLFGWKFIKLSDKNPCNDPCGSKILPSEFKTLVETNHGKYGKYSNKRKLEGECNLGAIKRFNLDSGLKQIQNPDLGLPGIQDN